MSWRLGPDIAGDAAAARVGSHIWCGIAMFRDLHAAEGAYERPQVHFPELASASEAWHALVQPVAHKGECNHLSDDQPGLMFEAASHDPGGPLVVVTSAGFDLRGTADLKRLIDFQRRVDAMRPVIATAEGHLAHQVFAPIERGADGLTMSLWRNDRSMFNFAYRPGEHRTQVERQKTEHITDRSSFTRFRVMRSAGQWNGADPLG